jgi:hypothetical protein
MRSCPKSKILRKSYSRKSYRRKDGSRVRGSKVKASCIEDKGKKGKGKRVIPELRRGALSKHGYAVSSPRSSRLKSLRKASREYGVTSVIHKLNVIATYNKTTHPEKTKKVRQDMEFVRKLRDGM